MITTATKDKGVNQHLREMPWGRKLYIPWDPADFNGQRGWWPEDRRGVVVDIPVDISGDGMIGEDVGLRYWADPNVPSLLGTGDSTGITLTRDASRGANNHIHLHDLCISNDRGPVEGVGDGIAFLGDFTIWDVDIHRVTANYAGRHGLHLAPPQNADGSYNYTVTTNVHHANFYGSGGDGVHIDGASTTLDFRAVSVPHSGRYGFWAKTVQTSRFDQIIAEHCGMAFKPGQPDACAIYLENCNACTLRPYTEEWFRNPVVKTAIILRDCNDCVIEAGSLYGGIEGLTGIKLINCKRCVVFPQAIAGWAPPLLSVVNVDAASRDNTIFPQAGKVIANTRRNNVL